MSLIDVLLGSEAGRALLFAGLAIWPLARMLRRAGRPPAIALLVMVPVVGLTIVMAVLAIRRWPTALPEAGRHPAGQART